MGMKDGCYTHSSGNLHKIIAYQKSKIEVMGYQISGGAGVIVKFHEIVTFDDILNVCSSMFRGRKSDEIAFPLMDFESIEGVNLDIRLAKSLIMLSKASMKYNPDNVISVISNNKDVINFFAEYKRGISGTTWQCHIFRSRAEYERELESDSIKLCNS